jgi:hypothetical protein
MKNLIYYPTFEPQDLSWIKYSLIYLDGFSPIIPETGQSTLSRQFKNIRDNTDLIQEVKPNWRSGDNASTKAIKELENVFAHPEQYRDKLNSVNPLRLFKDNNQWNFKLYEEKFNTLFKYYCLKEELAKETDGGILLSKELAEFYMTYLADEMAFDLKTSPITDNPKLDRLSSYLRINGNEQLLQTANTIVNVSLPTALNQIGINELIKFRNDTSIQELRKSFNKVLNDYIESIESEFDITEFAKHLEKTNHEFKKEIGLFFGGLTAATLGGIILLQNTNPNYIELAKAMIEGTSLLIGGGYSMNQSWKLNANRKNARKFLSRIKEIK